MTAASRRAFATSLPPAFERILIRLPNWLGDAMMARGLIHALRRAHPHACLRAVTRPLLVELMRSESVLDRIDPWGKGRPANDRLIRELRGWRPEVALVLPPSFSSAWFALQARASVRIGYRHEWRNGILTHALRRPMRGEMHLSEEYSALGAPMGAGMLTPPPLTVPTLARDAAHQLLARHGMGVKDFVVLAPGARYGPAKRWPEERFVAVGRVFGSRGLTVLVCGAAGEAPECLDVARNIGSGACSLAGETDLLTQAALCAESVAAVCNDSGMGHVSAAVGAPTVALFGSTSSAWTAPRGERVRVVQRAPVCSPCFQRTCRIGYGCLTAITVDDVLAACDEMASQ
jgi:heptosyltransferase-2